MKGIDDYSGPANAGDSVGAEELMGVPQIVLDVEGPFQGGFGDYLLVHAVTAAGNVTWRAGGGAVVDSLKRVGAQEGFPVGAVLGMEKSQQGRSYQVLRSPSEQQLKEMESWNSERPEPIVHTPRKGTATVVSPQVFVERMRRVKQLQIAHQLPDDDIVSFIQAVTAGERSDVKSLSDEQFETLCGDIEEYARLR